MSLKAMFYGAPGCGKTTLIGTACDDERLAPVLILDSKGNPEVLRNKKNKPDVIPIRSMAEYNEPYNWLANGQNPKDPIVDYWGLHPPYKTIAIDSLTETQRHVIRKVSGGESIQPGDLMPALGRQGFGQLMGTMLNWANYYLDLPLNIILASHENQKQDGANGPIRIAPLLWGQSGNELSGYVLLVMRLCTTLAMPANMKMEISQEAYNYGQVLETFPVYAKDQYGLGVKYIEDPTMSMVMDLIEQGS